MKTRSKWQSYKPYWKFKKGYCEECYTDKGLECHHRDGNSDNHTEDNIATLCHRCHMRLHWLGVRPSIRVPGRIMAKVTRSNRILSERILVLSFHQLLAFVSLLDMATTDTLRSGLSPKEQQRVQELKTQLNEVATTLRDMAGRIRSENL